MFYHDITKDDMQNGDGLRVVLWVSGCDHGCHGCHNPLTWDAGGGLPFDAAAKQEIFTQLDEDYIAGVTFTGGDPLYGGNRGEIGSLIREIKEKYPQKTIWLYTGEQWEDICGEGLLRDVDVLVDGKFVASEADVKLHWRGSGNQRVIDVKQTLGNDDPSVPKIYC